MRPYYGSGGNTRPYFKYRIKINKCTTEMWDWCCAYPGEGDHHRFHVEWKSIHHERGYDIVQFEREEPALMFTLKFGCI